LYIKIKEEIIMDDFYIDLPEKIKLVLNKLHTTEFQAYIVGGCVRDTLLCKKPYDFDITTSATPQEIKCVFKDYQQIDNGIKHGTVTVIIENECIEITTFRIDGTYSDGRRPDDVVFTTNILEDLSRRDFTINAVAATEKLLIDPYNGQEDIKNNIIRCVGDPKTRFHEDALRILRGIRFASVLSFKVEEKTMLAMFECKELLKNISQERITSEFCKTLLGQSVKSVLTEFKEILIYIIPEIKDTLGFKQHNPHHIYDVYVHSITAVQSIESDIILRVTMLFHDIAKPFCFTLDERKIGHFYGHPALSAHMTKLTLQRMKFSKEDINIVTQLIKYHDFKIELSSKSVKKLLNIIGEIQFRRLLKVKRADNLAHSLQFINATTKHLDNVEQILNNIIVANACITLQHLAINGDDLIELGIPKGKKIGTILNNLLQMVLNEELENNRDALLEKAKDCSF
jgi:tRNA nucleotidyltransferase (CCA-adding enzyme)